MSFSIWGGGSPRHIGPIFIERMVLTAYFFPL